jgi:transketolase
VCSSDLQGWAEALPVFQPEQGPLATRAASGQCLQALAQRLPQLLGGSADLAPSNNTFLKDSPAMARGSFGGRNIHFGVRELAMTAVTNGLALHGGLLPYCGTFLIFSDYMRPAIRLAALMRTKVIFVLTHDSVGVGEDGPTHQPVEQVMSLRAIPGLTVLRPAEANETAAAWRLAVARPGPVALALTRQNLPVLPAGPARSGVPRGGYVLLDAPDPDLVLLATGSEVHLALAAREILAGEGITARVVSLPSWEIFQEQDEAYRRAVLLPGVRKLALEAGVTLGWERWVGEGGAIIGLDRFGASAPGPVVFDRLGLNLAHVVAKAKELLGR